MVNSAKNRHLVIVVTMAHQNCYHANNMPVWSRSRGHHGHLTGRTRKCFINGCVGVRAAVQWGDGRVSWPCAIQVVQLADGDFQLSRVAQHGVNVGQISSVPKGGAEETRT